MHPKLKPDEEDMFSTEDDDKLINFVFTHGTYGVDRRGMKLYEVLGPKTSNEFAWSRHLPAYAWRERYCQHASEFDYAIAQHERNLDKPPYLPTTPPVIKSSTPRTKTTSGISNSNQSKPATMIHAPSTSETRKTTRIAVPADSQTVTTSGSSPPHLADPRAAAVVHKKLAKIGRKTMFSADFVWSVYSNTGSIERTREVVAEMESRASAIFARELNELNDESDDEEEIRAAKRRKVTDSAFFFRLQIYSRLISVID
ncbi:hypothetical protein B0H17DRAFT_1210116 [Mycena rosella]|uniref:Uncharacterized protein n=1 Tax=Mycena rosella TaxID=1033263 RepID=A0AAD7CWQ9_MYCRO|nr:hypothetical protein B0H17DRAFT_1210116 [Mycena rosella]